MKQQLFFLQRKNASGEQPKEWKESIGTEIGSLNEKGVHDRLTLKQIYDACPGTTIKFLHGKAIISKTPTHDGQGGSKKKFRICICGNGEEGTRGHDEENRAEVPSTMEMKTLITLGEFEGCGRTRNY